MTAFPSDALQRVLDETRQRFVATFGAQCDAIRILIDQVADRGPDDPVAQLTQVTHRLSGLAGTIGFPTVSARASQLEDLVDGTVAFNPARARDVVNAMLEAFTSDLASPAEWGLPAIAIAQGAKILLAEDEADQRAIVETCLSGAGYVPVVVASGDLVVATARAEKPAVILLDIAMPRLDGYSACRLLKADPELAHIPVIFMTTGANLDDKLAGLMLGADEFLRKPVDMRELVLRIQLLIERHQPRPSPAAVGVAVSKELTHDAFLAVLADEIQRSPAALAIVEVPSECRDEGSHLLMEEIRGRDAIGACGSRQLLILMPDMTAIAARDRLEPAVDRLIAHGLQAACVGITATLGAGTGTAETLMAQAGEALAEARYLGEKTAIWSDRTGLAAAVPAARTVVVADDDPDVIRIVDAQVHAAGYEAMVAFDGEQALEMVRTYAPDVLLLDLMMPKLNGFDVLAQLRESAARRRPRIIVLTARGREQDVVRAFELGADDYMTKPFNPQELMARIARLRK